MNFVGLRHKFFTVSAVLLLLSVIFLVFPGLNLGIDFTGGTLMERRVDGMITTESIRAVLADEQLSHLDIGTAVIQRLDSPNDFMVRTRTLANDEIAEVDQALDQAFGGLVERRTEMVGPVIGQELVRQAFWALLIAAFGILGYVSFRFEYRFAVAAIIAVLHDVILVLGVFAITGREINSPFVAAILTVVGYSINDTIVIFDRVRENLRLRKKETYEEVVNKSLNQTLSRSINTSLTTLIVVTLLFIFGGSSISDFAFALVIGVLAGTYSSIFVASPVWLEWTLAIQKKKVSQVASITNK